MKPPVRRSTHVGDDFIDGAGKAWDHKWVDPNMSVEKAAQDVAQRAAGGENILVADLSSLNPAKASLVRALVKAKLMRMPKAGSVCFVPAGVPEGSLPATVGGGVVGKEVGEKLEEK